MGKIAFVFSGQGAQKAGMGKAFYETNETVQALFDGAEALRAGTLKQCFEGTAEELKETQNTQPCLYLADLAAAIAVSEAGITPDGVAGFSLGEIPALAFAGAYSHLDGFQLAMKRGEVMAKAAAEHPASMLAVMKLENEKTEEICKQFRQVYPVNYNAPGQLVVAGAKEGTLVDKAIKTYCYILQSTPTFWIGLVLLMVFSVYLGWFPIGLSVPIGQLSDTVTFWQWLYRLILPAIS